jgi:FkbM family methyltransferase
MNPLNKIIFLLKITITYLQLKLKVKKVNLHNIWRLDFYIYSIKNEMKILKETNSYFIVEFKLNQNRKFIIRHRPSSDFAVFKSVIIDKQYSLNFQLKGNEQKVIIDAGANCGYTTIFFKDSFPNSFIYAVEPCQSNFEFLKANIQLNKLVDLKIINKALWYENDFLTLDMSFRDGLEHSVRTVKDVNNKFIIPAISLKNLINEFHIKNIDILKIDIEGAEAEIFDKDKHLSDFLKITKNIAIEIHDEFNCRENIESILNNHIFNLVEVGELTVATR